MNADGSNVVNLTTNNLTDCDPDWSLYGRKIAFSLVDIERDHETYAIGESEINVMNADEKKDLVVG